ncbi:MAG: hypothetical protein ABSE16_06030 [Verrucomicrobiota bacterium]
MNTTAESKTADPGATKPRTLPDDILMRSASERLEYAPTTQEFLRQLDSPAAEPNRPWPCLIYVDFAPVHNMVGMGSVVPHGVLAKYTPRTLAALLAGHEIFTPDEKQRLAEIERAIRRLYETMQQFTYQKANELFSNQVAETAKGEVTGETEITGDRDTLQREFRLKRAAIEEQVKPLAAEARALAGPVIKRAMDFLRESMADSEIGERFIALAYDIGWTPSLLWRCHASILMKFSTNRLHQELYPSSMLAGLLAAAGVNLTTPGK